VSYTREDCAVDVCVVLASADPDQMDPDELYMFAVQAVADAMHVRDGFDDNGYAADDDAPVNGYGEPYTHNDRDGKGWYQFEECSSCGSLKCKDYASGNGFCARCATE
jgi:hypothetical protein